MTIGEHKFCDLSMHENAAQDLVDTGRPSQDTNKNYYYIEGVDQSIAAGGLGNRIGEYYKALGGLHSAKHDCGRAVEERALAIPDYIAARKRREQVSIDVLVPAKKFIVPRCR